MRGSGDPHPDHLTGSDPPSAQNVTSSGPGGLGPETPWAPVVCIPAAHPPPWRWGAYVGMATAPMVTGMEGYAGVGHGVHHHHHRHALHLLTTSHTTNTVIRAHGHHAIWLMTANGSPPISVIQTSGSSSAMACIHPHPSVHHPSVHPYAMAVGSIRREGHGANGGRDGGPYTTVAHTISSISTTYGVATTMLILLYIPTAHGGIVATSSLHLSLQHHYWHIHIPIRWYPRCG